MSRKRRIEVHPDVRQMVEVLKDGSPSTLEEHVELSNSRKVIGFIFDKQRALKALADLAYKDVEVNTVTIEGEEIVAVESNPLVPLVYEQYDFESIYVIKETPYSSPQSFKRSSEDVGSFRLHRPIQGDSDA
jgi:hypothetical protein